VREEDIAELGKNEKYIISVIVYTAVYVPICGIIYYIFKETRIWFGATGNLIENDILIGRFLRNSTPVV